jgi:serine protease inhibitor
MTLKEALELTSKVADAFEGNDEQQIFCLMMDKNQNAGSISASPKGLAIMFAMYLDDLEPEKREAVTKVLLFTIETVRMLKGEDSVKTPDEISN